MSTERVGQLIVEERGAVRLVTMNRPAELNAFNIDMHVAFAKLWGALEDDTGARAVVLTGAGRAFSAGGDLDDFEARRVDFEIRRREMREARRLVTDMLDVRVPVIAAVNGPAVGLGCTLATLCDVVFIAESAFMADPHVTVGLVAGDGGAVTWPAMTSMLKAKHYLFTGDRIPAADAVALGLATFTVPPVELLDRALEYAQRLAGLPPYALQETKFALNQHLRRAALGSLALGLATESQAHDLDDYRDAIERNRRR